jgi:hypothetical protein
MVDTAASSSGWKPTALIHHVVMRATSPRPARESALKNPECPAPREPVSSEDESLLIKAFRAADSPWTTREIPREYFELWKKVGEK